MFYILSKNEENILSDKAVLEVKLEAFEGPLDLLLHLIEKNQVNIYDIPIVMITEQYMEYISKMQRNDMDVMSEFLVMAAELLNIKSKMLLPKDEEEEEEQEDPRAELVQRLLEHKLYKYISFELKDRQSDAQKIMFKESTVPKEILDFEEPVDTMELLSGVTLAKLQSIFNMVIKKQEDRIDPIRSKFGNIEKEEISLVDKISFIDGYGREHHNFSFRKLLETSTDKMEVIVTFLGVLELIRMGRIHILQENLFEDILIEYNDDCDDLDENYDISFS